VSAAGWGALALVCTFGAAGLAMCLRRMLPDHHLAGQAQDTVRIAMGLVATMAALILGLLVTAAKGTYDAQQRLVIEMASELALLDGLLNLYGPEAAAPRELLHDSVRKMVQQHWRETTPHPDRALPDTASAGNVYFAIRGLSPHDDGQRELQARALDSAYAIGRMRWLLFAQSGSAISTPLLVVVLCWLGLLFLSFGLFAPRNSTVLTVLFLSAVAVSSALFLILELDGPFDGLIRVSDQPLRGLLDVYAHPAA